MGSSGDWIKPRINELEAMSAETSKVKMQRERKMEEMEQNIQTL